MKIFTNQRLVDLRELKFNSLSFLQYLERYVNDGSPSGFTNLYRTGPETDPWGDIRSFNLKYFEDDFSNFTIYGSMKSSESIGLNNFYIHPDMAHHPDLKGFQIHKETKFEVTPTSSARTVQIINNKNNNYVKLYYDGLVGRNNRKLYTKKAISGPEISNIILKCIQNNQLSAFLSILHEPFSKIHINRNIIDNEMYWGFIWRESKPKGINTKEIDFIIPFFSLWSTDKKRQIKNYLLSYLAEIWGGKSENIITEYILKPIIDIHFELISKLGLQFEFNAQNILLGFNKNCFPKSIILRDMMDTEKDIYLRKSLGLSCHFDSDPYHMIYNNNHKFAQMRRSFAFDFKLSTYVIEPLLDFCSKMKLFNKKDKIGEIKEHSKKWISKLPKAYFPENGWYAYDKVLIDKKKVHVKRDNPLLR